MKLANIYTPLREWARPGQRRLFISMAALTLGAGIGVSTAVFALVDGIFLRPSPIRDAARVLVVWPVRRSAPKDQAAYTLADFRAFEAVTRAFSSLAAINLNGAIAQPVGPMGSAEMVNTAVVTSGFTRTLGLVPTVGRPFEGADHDGGPGTGVEISYRYWRRHTGAIGTRSGDRSPLQALATSSEAYFRRASTIHGARTCG